LTSHRARAVHLPHSFGIRGAQKHVSHNLPPAAAPGQSWCWPPRRPSRAAPASTARRRGRCLPPGPRSGLPSSATRTCSMPPPATPGPPSTPISAPDRKLFAESRQILEAALSGIEAEKPDFLLVCGDLTKDGEPRLPPARRPRARARRPGGHPRLRGARQSRRSQPAGLALFRRDCGTRPFGDSGRVCRPL